MARILMVVRPSKGGAFGHVSRLGLALAERGHEVAVCGPHGSLDLPPGLEVIHVDINRSIAPRAHARSVAEMAKAMRRFEPDLIHAHGSQGGVVARLARVAFPRPPLAFSPHNYAFTNWFASRLERGAYRGIEAALSPLATRVICVCEAERRLAASVGSRWRARVVYNGIDPFEELGSDPELERLAAAGPLVVCVTELHAPKGVPTLLESWPAVLAAHPRASLAIAGDGPMRAEVEALIEGLGVGASVHLLGQLADVTPLLRSGAVAVAPGWAESFPYAILEAMGSALPIVATDVGGVGEAIEDGVTGRLVPAHDPERLAAATVALIDDRETAERLGAAARRRALERFSFAGMVNGTLAVYDEIARL